MTPFTRIPFNIQIFPKEGRIVLTGDLDGSDAVYKECCRALDDVQEPPQTRTPAPVRIWIVDAARMRLPRGGVENWTKVVMSHLSGCELVYERSQLAMNLAYDERYPHMNSKFHEDDSPSA